MSWYRKNFDGVDEAQAEKEQFRKNRENQIIRFWLKENTDAEITFVDDIAFSFDEHQLRINGDFRNWYTCSKNLHGQCPLCEQGDHPSFVTMFTIIDHREWVDKQGTKHTNQRKLLAAKSDVAKTLQRKKDKLQGLAGKRFSVYRKTANDNNTGSDFDFIGHEDLAKYGGVQAIDYEVIFKPMSPQEMIADLESKGYVLGAKPAPQADSGARGPVNASPQGQPSQPSVDDIPW